MNIDPSLSSRNTEAAIMLAAAFAGSAATLANQTPNAYAQSAPLTAEPNVAGPHEDFQFVDGIKPDGTEYTQVPGGPTPAEQEKADIKDCLGIASAGVTKVVAIRMASKDSSKPQKTVVAKLTRKALPGCDPYLQLTSVTKLESKAEGQKKWHLGDDRISSVTTTTGRDSYPVTLSLGQTLKPGETKVRPVTHSLVRSKTVGYEGFDYGSTTRTRTVHGPRAHVLRNPARARR